MCSVSVYMFLLHLLLSLSVLNAFLPTPTDFLFFSCLYKYGCPKASELDILATWLPLNLTQFLFPVTSSQQRSPNECGVHSYSAQISCLCPVHSAERKGVDVHDKHCWSLHPFRRNEFQKREQLLIGNLIKLDTAPKRCIPHGQYCSE